jgi:hypothetical protein
LRQIGGSFDKILGQLQERDVGNCVSLIREYYGEKKNKLIKSLGRQQKQSASEALGEYPLNGFDPRLVPHVLKKDAPSSCGTPGRSVKG